MCVRLTRMWLCIGPGLPSIASYACVRLVQCSLALRMCALVLIGIVRLFMCSACACVRGHALTCPKSSVCSFSQPVLAFVCTFVYALCLY